jgi:hypothetical protein
VRDLERGGQEAPLDPPRRIGVGRAIATSPDRAVERQAIRKIALDCPTDHGEPFAPWSLTKSADHLVRRGVVEDISHEGLRALLHEEGVPFQALRTWKESNDAPTPPRAPLCRA